jgi:hypothetical protein
VLLITIPSKEKLKTRESQGKQFSIKIRTSPVSAEVEMEGGKSLERRKFEYLLPP